MRKITIIIVIALLLFNSLATKADEGMWILSLLEKNYDDMKKQGLKLSVKDIYDINQASMKDGIVGLSRENSPFWHFCSGELVSDQGLFITNHHCGYGMIQSHSTVEHDYLKDGFWAKDKSSELSNEGITAEILIKIIDVTEKVKGSLESVDIDERQKKFELIEEELVKVATEGTHYKGYVASMFEGNQYFVFVYEIFQDIRLVGAPPSSMGKFGGDTDNWMWPRHTADFSMFRIYTAKDGKPAKFSKENIPLKPRHFFPINISGVKENDFAMIMGFPGTTNRYMTSFELEETMNITNLQRYLIRTEKLNVMKADMAADPKVRIQYASKAAGSANYWKYSFVQNKALKKLNTLDNKRKIETEYLEWAKTQKDTDKYINALKNIENSVAKRSKAASMRSYISEALIRGPELPYFSYRMHKSLSALSKGELEAKEIQGEIDNFYKDYNPDTEKKLISTLFEYFYNNTPKDKQPDIFASITKKYKGNFEKYADDLFKKSIFATQESVNEFLQKPSLKKLDKDPVYLAGISFMKEYRNVMGDYREASKGFDNARHIFLKGILQINNNKVISPDANSTIRLSYGNVKSYKPRNAVSYSYYTTLEGVMEKEDSESLEFFVPEKLKELYLKKDYGIYANKKGELPTCFITNNDITGGNSGSPVFNAEGHLIGTAFDGNSEAMSGDIEFEDNMQRCINLDIRYTLFIIEKYAGATHLIKEMKIIR